ncbi:hypothetical protein MTP03_31480 [Tsukamurella sp. PLM1]|nr:hypothetical protein MTP03_31480 [Tsukamurella sp. PLM1]
MPVEMFGHESTERQAECSADSEGCADQGDSPTEPLRRHDIAKNRDPQWDDTGNCSLKSPRDDQRRDIVRERRENRAAGLQQQERHDHTPLAEHVTEPPGDRSAHSSGHQGGRDRPRRVIAGGVEQPRQLALNRDEDRLHERRPEPREGEHGEDHPRASFVLRTCASGRTRAAVIDGDRGHSLVLGGGHR